MSFVKVAGLHTRQDSRLRYTVEDWRLDVLATRSCQTCREPALFHEEQTAECIACGFWFDGLVAGRRTDEPL